jgi:hypothetical protein
MKLIKFSTLLVICLCLAGIVNGQETTGVIEGTVVDAQGGGECVQPHRHY